MNSCARWHRSDCSKPEITTRDGIPDCLSCHASSAISVAGLVAQNAGGKGKIEPPKDAPLGESTFWWPPCVPYKDTRGEIRRASDDRAGPTNPSGTDSVLSSASTIYPSCLDSEHFRIICLAPSDYASSPIHINFEEYSFDDCPEYETVSYLWGGQNDNYTLCKPVYVGIFWDIVLVTENCSAVLHYLRPLRGSRFIWLDAICINQADETEKPAQISKMCDIYSNCQRVVAYFGSDLVSQPPGRAFRPRVDFQQSALFSGKDSDLKDNSAKFLTGCAEIAGLSQEDLLKRRYLTRIWIVQELLLSKKAIFPLGDSDVICDGKETINLVLRAERRRFRIFDVDWKSLFSLWRAAFHCEASDPRDKVFGLLGLFQPQDPSRKLIPNYTLSWRDCWVGTCAYMLLVERNLALLTHAVGSNDLHQPTWVLDSQNPDSSVVDLASIVLRVQDGIMHADSSQDYDSSGSSSTLAASESWVTELLMYSMNDKEVRVDTSKRPSRRLIHPTLCTQNWKEASINPSDGGLNLQAFRVFDAPCQVTVEAETGDLTSIWVRGPSAAARFRVMGLRESLTQDEKYQLFIIPCQDLDSSDPSEHGFRLPDGPLLALTTILVGSNGSCAKLHTCCMVYDVHLYSMDRLQLELPGLKYFTNELHSLHKTLHDLREVVMSSYTPGSGYDWILPCIFPSLESRTGQILELMILLTEPRSRKEKAVELADELKKAAENICPGFEPQVSGNHFYLTAKNSEMFSLLSWIWQRRITTWEWHSFIGASREDLVVDVLPRKNSSTRRGRKWTRLSFRGASQKEEWQKFWKITTFPAEVRFPVKFLLSCLAQTTPGRTMRYAREYSKSLHEDVEVLLQRSSRPEDRCVFIESWGPSLVEELKLAWKFETITIA